MFFKILCLSLLAATFCITAIAQSDANRKADDQAQVGGRQSRASGDDDSRPMGSPEDEMRARNEIKYYEKLHQENVDRAREAAELSTKLRAVYDTNKSFGPAERKNLERIEKLVRRIRTAAGGSNGDADETDALRDLPAALSRLTEASDALRMGVEKTPRMVVSATVIEQSNELLQLLRYLRAATR